MSLHHIQELYSTEYFTHLQWSYPRPAIPDFQQYVDDTQVYIAAHRTYSRQLASLEECLGAVHTWLLHNSLCLNPAKSDVIVFTPSRQQHTTKLDTVSVSSQPVIPSLTVKSLGVVLDNRLSMDQHVAAFARTAIFIYAHCTM